MPFLTFIGLWLVMSDINFEKFSSIITSDSSIPHFSVFRWCVPIPSLFPLVFQFGTFNYVQALIFFFPQPCQVSKMSNAKCQKYQMLKMSNAPIKGILYFCGGIFFISNTSFWFFLRLSISLPTFLICSSMSTAFFSWGPLIY